MKAYVYRVSAAEDENVYRDILIQEDKTFEDFHFAILDAFDLNEGEMASFFTSTETGDIGLEIMLMDMGTMEFESVNILMQELTIAESVKQDVKYYVYQYDFLFPKNFNIERIGENKDIKEDIPVLLALVGDYNPPTSDEFGDMNFDDMLDEGATYKKKSDFSGEFDEFDNFNDDYDDDDEVRFENIDDYDL